MLGPPRATGMGAGIHLQGARSSRRSAGSYTVNNLAEDPKARCGRLTPPRRDGYLKWPSVGTTRNRYDYGYLEGVIRSADGGIFPLSGAAETGKLVAAKTSPAGPPNAPLRRPPAPSKRPCFYASYSLPAEGIRLPTARCGRLAPHRRGGPLKWSSVGTSTGIGPLIKSRNPHPKRLQWPDTARQ